MPSWTENSRRYRRWSQDAYARYYAPREQARPAPTSTIDAAPAACIEINASWRSHVVGALEILLQDDAWLDSDRDFAKSQIYRLIEMLSEICKEMTDNCCPETNEKLQGVIDALEEIADALAAANADANGAASLNLKIAFDNRMQNKIAINAPIIAAYDGSPASVAPTIITTGGWGGSASAGTTGNEALCSALKAYATEIFKEASLLAASLGLIAGAAASVAAAALTGGTSLLVQAAVAAGAGLTVGGMTLSQANALSETSSINDVLCCMQNGLKGQAITFESFKSSAQSCGFNFPSNEAQLAGILHNANQSETNYLNFLKIYAKTQSGGDTADCGCDCTELEFVPSTPADGWTMQTLREGSVTYNPETFIHTIVAARYRFTNTATGQISNRLDWNVRTGACCNVIEFGPGEVSGWSRQNCNGSEVGGIGGVQSGSGWKILRAYWIIGEGQYIDEPVIYTIRLMMV